MSELSPANASPSERNFIAADPATRNKRCPCFRSPGAFRGCVNRVRGSALTKEFFLCGRRQPMINGQVQLLDFRRAFGRDADGRICHLREPTA